MTNLRWGRVALAGSCAGIVFVAGGMVSALVMDLPETFGRFNVEPTAGAALVHSALRMGLGLAAVLLYVGFRGGMGSRPQAAMWSSMLLWFVGYVPGSVVLHELGVLSSGQLGFALLWGILETCVATFLGASLYRPRPETDPVGSRGSA